MTPDARFKIVILYQDEREGRCALQKVSKPMP